MIVDTNSRLNFLSAIHQLSKTVPITSNAKRRPKMQFSTRVDLLCLNDSM